MSVFEARGPHLRVVPETTHDAQSDVELEGFVLGAVLFSAQVLPVLSVDEGLTAGMFYWPWHGRVWSAMLELHQAGEPVELATVSRLLADRGGKPEDVGKLDLLAIGVPNIGSVRHYARRLVELAEWRTVKTAGVELAAAADSLDEARRERAENMLAGRSGTPGTTMTAAALGDELWEHLTSTEAMPVGLPVPWDSLARALPDFSFRPGETSLIGAWTSRGKSSAIDSILTKLGRAGHRVHLYINEGDTKVRGLRILSAESGVPLSRLMARITMSDRERQASVEVLKRGMPFGITECAGWGAPEIVRDLRYRKWDLAVIDHLHLIEYREERDLASISQQITIAAQVTGTHVIAAVQLNEERAKQAILPPPVLRDIRGSGMLKNDAHNVFFVHRSDDTDEKGVVTVGNDSQIYLAKCRNGSLGACALTFDGACVRFVDVDRDRFAA
jgi:replicative DNA helicase